MRMLGLVLVLIAAAAAHAEGSADASSAGNLDQIVVTAKAIDGPEQAPSQGSLIATEPQSIVSNDFIQNDQL